MYYAYKSLKSATLFLDKPNKSFFRLTNRKVWTRPLRDQTWKMEHPITKAILDKNLESLEELIAKHEKELDKIEDKITNEKEQNRFV